MTTAAEAVRTGDVNAYMQAVTRDPAFVAVFPNGVTREAEQGIRADFERDQLRTRAGQGLNMDNLGQSLQGLWDKIKTGDIMGFFQQLLSVFNTQADPQRLAALDQSVTAGMTGMTPEQRALYAGVIDQNKPAGTPALPPAAGPN